MEKKFEVPKELVDSVYQILEEAKRSGKLRKGTNETTKSVERAESKLVVIAEDVNPSEIIMHIPMLCEEKSIPYVFVPKKSELGAAAGLPVGSSAISVVNPGEAAKKLQGVVRDLEVLAVKNAKPEVKEEKKVEEKPKEEKPKEVKKDEKKAEPKEVPKKEEKPKEEAKAEKKDEKPAKEEKKDVPKAVEKPKAEKPKEVKK